LDFGIISSTIVVDVPSRGSIHGSNVKYRYKGQTQLQCQNEYKECFWPQFPLSFRLFNGYSPRDGLLTNLLNDRELEATQVLFSKRNTFD
jgi:hypothetical protein